MCNKFESNDNGYVIASCIPSLSGVEDRGWCIAQIEEFKETKHDTTWDNTKLAVHFSDDSMSKEKIDSGAKALDDDTYYGVPCC